MFTSLLMSHSCMPPILPYSVFYKPGTHSLGCLVQKCCFYLWSEESDTWGKTWLLWGSEENKGKSHSFILAPHLVQGLHVMKPPISWSEQCQTSGRIVWVGLGPEEALPGKETLIRNAEMASLGVIRTCFYVWRGWRMTQLGSPDQTRPGPEGFQEGSSKGVPFSFARFLCLLKEETLSGWIHLKMNPGNNLLSEWLPHCLSLISLFKIFFK